MSRLDERKEIATDGRVGLLEGDLDRHDGQHKEASESLTKDLEKLGNRIDNMTKVMITLLVTIAGTGVTVAVAVVVAQGG